MKRAAIFYIIILSYTAFIGFPAQSMADTHRGQEDSEDHGKNEGRWAIGVVCEYSKSPYRGDDSDFEPFPFISFRGERFYIEGPEIGFTLIEWKDFEISVLGEYRFDGYEANDSEFLRGMEDRDGTVEAGLNIEYESPFGEIELEFLTDVLGEHEGQEISLTYGLELESGSFSIQPFVGLKWQSSNLADYYYGVKETEATVARSVYNVGSTINYGLGLDIGYKISDHWMVMLGVEVDFLNSDIKDSPIVDESTLFEGTFIIIYGF